MPKRHNPTPYSEQVHESESFYNVQLTWKNFTGVEREYNDPGRRNFGIIIPDAERALSMKEAGWNIWVGEPREDDAEHLPGETRYILPVEVSYRGYEPPEIVMSTPDNPDGVTLDESNVGQLDKLRISKANVVVNPSNWYDKDAKKNRVKAYLDGLYVLIESNGRYEARRRLRDEMSMDTVTDEDKPF